MNDMEQEKEIKLLKEGESKSIGNYVFMMERCDDGRWFVLKSVSGCWQVRWRDDMLMFGVLTSLVGNPDAEEYLHCLATFIYISTTYPHDLVSLSNRGTMPLMEGFYHIIQDQNAYELSMAPAASQKDDERVLRDTVEYERLKEDLSRIYDDDEHEQGEIQPPSA